MNVKAGLQSMMFKKALRLSAAARHQVSNGEVENLASNDSQRVSFVYYFISYSIAAPIQLTVLMYLIYEEVGNAMWLALAIPMLTFPLQRTLGAALEKHNKQALEASDERVKLVQELVNGIRLVKYYAWERWFSQRIQDAREEELKSKFSIAMINAVNQVLLLAAPILSAVAVFLSYGYLIDEELTPSKAFTSLALLQQLRLPFMVMPFLISAIISANVANKRIWKLMSLSERVDYLTIEPATTKDGSVPPAVEFKSAKLHWLVPNKGDSQDQQDANDAAAAANADDISVSVSSKTAAAVPDLSKDGKKGPVPAVAGPPKAPAGSLDDEKEVELMPGFSLENLNLAFESGKLTTIVGSVGAGKSSVLGAMLGDMQLDSGAVIVRSADGKEAPPMLYCPQQAQIWNATVRENILFGQEYDETLYRKVVWGCQLFDDFAQLTAGDQTEIGERGISLSGGQKARVALARAVYAAQRQIASDAKVVPIVLLDDVLSAVDAHVAKKLFKHALLGLLSKCTRVFVSHQLQFLPGSHAVVVMEGGRVVQSGSYQQVLSGEGSGAESALGKMLADRAVADDVLSGGAAVEVDGDESDGDVEAPPSGADESGVEGEGAAQAVLKQSSTGGAAEQNWVESEKKDGVLVQAEELETGAVKWEVYRKYLTSMGTLALSIMVASLLLSNITQVGTNYWLSVWSSDSLDESTEFYLQIYAIVNAAAIVMIFLYQFAWAFGQVEAGRTLHHEMLTAIVRAPTSFYDQTPAGRLHNRFSSDVNLIDKDLPSNFSQYINYTVSILATLLLQAVVFPFVLLGFVPLGIIYVFMARVFRFSNRELQRLQNISRSPVFNLLGESLAGVATLRAYKAEERYIEEHDKRVDHSNVAFWYVNLSNRWLGVRLDWLGSFMVAVTTVAAIATAGDVDPGLAALSITYALTITNLLNWLVRTQAQTESFLASVERVQHYTRVEQEAPAHIPETAPPAEWPQAGQVQFEKYSMRYREGAPLVLKEVSFTVPPGAKVGVCGRTGAGKSSLMAALFRMVEAASGRIVIDGVDISTIGLDDLRSKMAIIPQDPVLFEGTLRYNLDVQGKHSDEELWSTLDLVGLKDTVRALSGGLSGHVTEGGSNFSVGQRQLLCMSRAMLRNARVVVLDEATAAVDVSTDALLQRAIREVFRGTVMTVAHRLDTIADSDFILSLDKGEVAEFAPPAELRKDKNGLYYSLWSNARDASAAGANEAPSEE